MRRPLLTATILLLATGTNLVSHAQTVAISNARIYTMGKAGVITNGTVIVRNDKIAAVGQQISIPPDAIVINAEGKIVTPGLFDAYSYLGLVEILQAAETVDNVQLGRQFSAGFDIVDAINPRSTLIPVNRIEGITRALAAPATMEEGSFIAGLGAVIHLGSVDSYLVKSSAAMFAEIGEFGALLAGGSRAAAIIQLREMLRDARDYAANKDAYDAGERRPYAATRLDLEALVDVLDRRLPLVLGANRASDIEAALRLADDFSLRLIIAGAAEGWLVANKIAARNVPVILDPTLNLPFRFETLGARLDNAALLNKAGVLIAFATGDSHNSRNLKQAAGNAVANGLPYRAALQALTVNPARMYQVHEQYGRIAPGMDADLVVWNNDPLEVTSFAERVFIRGRDIPMVSRQTLLRDRYLQRITQPPPAQKN